MVYTIYLSIIRGRGEGGGAPRAPKFTDAKVIDIFYWIIADTSS